MEGIRIDKPCSENWNDMNPTEKGAFCLKCSKEVIDFSNKLPLEIKRLLLENAGGEVCGKITDNQLTALNQDFQFWSNSTHKQMQRVMLFSLIVVFGMTMLSCTNQKEKEVIEVFQQKAISLVLPESASVERVELIANSEQISNNRAVVAVELQADVVEILNKEIVLELDTVIETIPERPIEEHFYILGAMAFTTRHVEFLDSVVTEIDEYDAEGRLIPKDFDVLAFPNPTRLNSTVKLDVPETGQIAIYLYNINGEMLQTIASKEFLRGTHELNVNLLDYKPGTYLIIVNSENFQKTIKISKI